MFFMLRATKILLVYLLFLEQVATVVTPAALVFSVYMYCIKRLAEGRQSIKSFSHFNGGLCPADFQWARTKAAINIYNIMIAVVKIKFCKHSDKKIGNVSKKRQLFSFPFETTVIFGPTFRNMWRITYKDKGYRMSMQIDTCVCFCVCVLYPRRQTEMKCAILDGSEWQGVAALGGYWFWGMSQISGKE